MSTMEDIRDDAEMERWMEKRARERWDDDSCVQCGTWLEETEGTTCEGGGGVGCGVRLCASCVTAKVVDVPVSGEFAKTIRFLCPNCLRDEEENG